MDRERLYEIECTRKNVSPKEFFSYCAKRCKENGAVLTDWIEYNDWIKPSCPGPFGRYEYSHEDWAHPLREVIKYMPYDFQIYLEDTYNFIMEFEFDTETKGHGYFYLLEYDIPVSL